jgi:hypothetical protein
MENKKQEYFKTSKEKTVIEKKKNKTFISPEINPSENKTED